MVTVVLDSMAGSCGKGKFIGYLANADCIEVAIDNFMSNAGHTYVYDNGKKVMTQHLPTSIVNPDTVLMIGPGSAITPSILFDEILKFKDIIGRRKLYINPRAVVIKEKHRQMEREVLRSGSTFKGCGGAQADKLMRQAELFGEWWYRLINGKMDYTPMCHGDESDDDIIEGKDCEFDYLIRSGDLDIVSGIIEIADTMTMLNDFIDNDCDIIIEGSQGCDLDINYGLDYPNTTSRQCHVGQLVADCGISPVLVDEIIMIMRPYPIRISNETNICNDNGEILVTSSGEYGDSDEISWDIIKERCGAPFYVNFGEFTTVTKKPRRVFEMNWKRLEYACKLNRPTQIALNFAQYLDWDAYECTEYDKLPESVIMFIEKVEEVTGVPVTLIGTGARNSHIIDVREIKGSKRWK